MAALVTTPSVKYPSTVTVYVNPNLDIFSATAQQVCDRELQTEFPPLATMLLENCRLDARI